MFSPLLGKGLPLPFERVLQLMNFDRFKLAVEERVLVRDPGIVRNANDSTKWPMHSTLVEHINNSMNNSRSITNWGGRYQRPQTYLSASIRADTIGKCTDAKRLDRNVALKIAAKP